MSRKADVSLHEAWIEVENMVHPGGHSVLDETGMGNASGIGMQTPSAGFGMGMENLDDSTEVLGMRTGRQNQGTSSVTAGDWLGFGNVSTRDLTTAETFGTGMEFNVLDVAASKKASWSRAVHLLETIFLSKRVLIHQQ